ncbi:MAG: AmmeMemoRadiSam system radical SAM enzyme [Candidatus Hermodarchaeia archaeon]|jgi:pyruvate formate lyase activating enzyme
MQEAMLYNKLEDNKVGCYLCGRRCTIADGKLGYCQVRKNTKGTLFSLVYGKACSANPDPIEKKPLWHFRPGSLVMSVATVGCNFRCQFCQNWQISHERDIIGRKLSPAKIVDYALDTGCTGVSYTYTEPTIFFEYAYDTAKIAQQKGLFNTFVTNGYMTTEAIETIAPYLDAATVDFKGNANPLFYKNYCNVPSVDPIFDSLKAMKAANIHIEITNLLVSDVGDDTKEAEALAQWIVQELGEDTPLHLLRFYPHHKMSNLPPTSIKKLEAAATASARAGLKYVYLGNVPGHQGANTICDNCGALLIERLGIQTISVRLTRDGRCPSCNLTIPVTLSDDVETSE